MCVELYLHSPIRLRDVGVYTGQYPDLVFVSHVMALSLNLTSRVNKYR